jgi:hypothetical protein
VRALFVLVLVFGIWLGWLVRSARIQRDAVVAIRQAGGLVTYNWGWKLASPGIIATFERRDDAFHAAEYPKERTDCRRFSTVIGCGEID